MCTDFKIITLHMTSKMGGCILSSIELRGMRLKIMASSIELGWGHGKLVDN